MTAGPTALVEALQTRYAFERELGCGGMATVYLARDLQRDSLVAVKVLRPDLLPGFGAERFAREIRITSRLSHPNILPVLDSGQVAGVPFYVTPFIDGESLAQRMKREVQLPISDAIDIACDVAEALQAAHSQGFVHRDIKPSNILLARGRTVLADFGIARAVEILTDDKLTESGISLGTPAYMSPEQSGCGTIDARSDTYSLACVLFEMLTGTPPFSGSTAQSIQARHAVDPVPSIHTVRQTVVPSLEHVIVKAMAKVPADRYETVEQFRQALRGIDLAETIPVPRQRRYAVISAAGFAVVAAVALASPLVLRRTPELDRNRILVYPLIMPREVGGPRSTGEDVATMIGNVLDGTGPLRWIDAWPLLESRQREDIRTLSSASARSLAREKRCAYYVSGRLVARGDSVEVFLELNDVRGDSTIARGRSTRSVGDSWRAALHAVNALLPQLIPGSSNDIVAEWKDRNPSAIASLLLGEAAFRRLHLGEALAHYRRAVEADSVFGLAALRGAQAATWNHRPDEAAAFIRLAVRQEMSPRYAHFTRGYDAYLSGLADSAAAEFRRAVAADPEMAEAWMQLGEVYTHLLPEAGNPDSLAASAFEEARRLDPGATGLLFHLIEIRLRNGQFGLAEPLLRDFLAASPDTMLASQVRIMDSCLRRGPRQVSWKHHATSHPLALLAAGNMLKGAGAQLPCATEAFAAVFSADTVAGPWGDARRWMALVGLQGIYLAQGRVEEAAAAIDSGIARGVGGSSLLLLNASLHPAFERAAGDVARRDRIEFGEGYAKCPFPNRLWVLGIWSAHVARSSVVAVIERAFQARTLGPDSSYNRLGARSMAAHGVLLRGDTAKAIQSFAALLSEPLPDGDLNSDLVGPRGTERLTLVRLLIAKGEFQRAIEVANVFDSAWPVVYALYLPASLKLRAEAAVALGRSDLARHYESRYADLRGDRTFAMQ